MRAFVGKKTKIGNPAKRQPDSGDLDSRLSVTAMTYVRTTEYVGVNKGNGFGRTREHVGDALAAKVCRAGPRGGDRDGWWPLVTLYAAWLMENGLCDASVWAALCVSSLAA